MTSTETFAETFKKDHAGFVSPTRVAPIERVPKWALCVPLVVQWFWLGARFGSLTLPTVVNPQIETGGLAGESKFACLKQISSTHRDKVALSLLVESYSNPEALRRQHGLEFPLIAKPDIGCSGYGVRRLDDSTELLAYKSGLPKTAALILQRLIEAPSEAGLLYIRRPGTDRGKITALTLRHRPFVVGDGKANVLELIAQQAPPRRLLAFYRTTIAQSMLASIPKSREHVPLTTVASVRVGGQYESASHLITPRLEDSLDAVARSMGDFHYGRFDVKFVNEDALRDGQFIIFEINGAGSEAIQYWDPRIPISKALQGIFAKQRELFLLAHESRQQGNEPLSVKALASSYLKQKALIQAYPSSN